MKIKNRLLHRIAAMNRNADMQVLNEHNTRLNQEIDNIKERIISLQQNQDKYDSDDIHDLANHMKKFLNYYRDLLRTSNERNR